nr:hypothetical protein [Variovorax paradoxus]
MSLSSRIFLLSGDDMLHALAGNAFMRMLRKEDNCRIPDFAGQRVRQAHLVVEVVDRNPVQVVHQTFCVLDIDTDGLLDVERLNLQQFARVEDFLAQVPQSPAQSSAVVVEAANRFVAQGGSWQPDERLQVRLHAAALGKLACPRVRVVR